MSWNLTRPPASTPSEARQLAAPKTTLDPSTALLSFRPSCIRSRVRGTTIHSVKAYRIERIKGGMKFTCARCAHSVSTLDFDARTGNLRTQAANEINDPAAQAD